MSHKCDKGAVVPALKITLKIAYLLFALTRNLRDDINSRNRLCSVYRSYSDLATVRVRFFVSVLCDRKQVGNVSRVGGNGRSEGSSVSITAQPFLRPLPCAYTFETVSFPCQLLPDSCASGFEDRAFDSRVYSPRDDTAKYQIQVLSNDNDWCGENTYLDLVFTQRKILIYTIVHK